MSSSAGFSFTYCRVASCAFATSDSSPIDAEGSFFRSVSDCYPQTRLQPCRLHHPQPRDTPVGTVLSVAESCRLWNAFPQPYFFSDLHLPHAGAQHEVTSSTRNLTRAAARMPVVCLVRIKEPFHLHSRSSQTSERRYSLDHRALHPHHTDRNRSNDKLQKLLTLHTNPIDRRAASFKSLYLQRPRRTLLV
jgi:hypothetical protein